jgi:tryptophan synthase alpha chain
MVNPIDTVFSEGKGLKLMTHVVAGYPDIETSGRLIEVMAESGADLVEIQVPFSDPLADGPTIAIANQAALESGTTPDQCFQLARQLSKKINIPLLFMTYANIPFSMGMERFIRKSKEAGISGFIIPDLPFDADNGEYIDIAKSYGCYPIAVVSPGMSAARLKKIVQSALGFIYTTLRVGITGARRSIDDKGLKFLETLGSYTQLPIAAGFGISSAEMLEPLKTRADAAVIGSHIINLFNRDGIEAVAYFIRSCNPLVRVVSGR